MLNSGYTKTSTTTINSNSSTKVLRTRYLKTLSGILDCLEVSLGVICLMIARVDANFNKDTLAKLFFVIATSGYVMISFYRLLTTLSSGSMISKTVYEVIYYAIGFSLLLTASLSLLAEVNRDISPHENYDAVLTAGVIGSMNSALHLISTIVTFRTYRGN